MNQSVLDEFKLSDLLAITPLLTLVLTILILLFCPQFYQNRHMPPPAMFKCVYMYIWCYTVNRVTVNILCFLALF